MSNIRHNKINPHKQRRSRKLFSKIRSQVSKEPVVLTFIKDFPFSIIPLLRKWWHKINTDFVLTETFKLHSSIDTIQFHMDTIIMQTLGKWKDYTVRDTHKNREEIQIQIGLLKIHLNASFTNTAFGYTQLEEKWSLFFFHKSLNPLIHFLQLPFALFLNLIVDKHRKLLMERFQRKIYFTPTRNTYHESNKKFILFTFQHLLSVELELPIKDIAKIFSFNDSDTLANDISQKEKVCIISFKCQSYLYNNLFTDTFENKLPICMIFFIQDQSYESLTKQWHAVGFYSTWDPVTVLIRKKTTLKIMEPDLVQIILESKQMIINDLTYTLKTGSESVDSLSDDFQIKYKKPLVKNENQPGVLQSYSISQGEIKLHF